MIGWLVWSRGFEEALFGFLPRGVAAMLFELDIV